MYQHFRLEIKRKANLLNLIVFISDAQRMLRSGLRFRIWYSQCVEFHRIWISTRIRSIDRRRRWRQHTCRTHQPIRANAVWLNAVLYESKLALWGEARTTCNKWIRIDWILARAKPNAMMAKSNRKWRWIWLLAFHTHDERTNRIAQMAWRCQP